MLGRAVAGGAARVVDAAEIPNPEIPNPKKIPNPEIPNLKGRDCVASHGLAARATGGAAVARGAREVGGVRGGCGCMGMGVGAGRAELRDGELRGGVEGGMVMTENCVGKYPHALRDGIGKMLHLLCFCDIPALNNALDVLHQCGGAEEVQGLIA